MSKRVRGEQRFGAITYSLLSHWVGLKLSTVQAYGARGQFDPNDMVGILQWVGEQCRARGRPAPWEKWRLSRLPNKLAQELGFWCYKDFMKSDMWQNLRRKVHGPCFKCGGKADSVHHRRYTLENMRGDTTQWLAPVCKQCHILIHGAGGEAAEDCDMPEDTIHKNISYSELDTLENGTDSVKHYNTSTNKDE